ncbi:hypothetical protein [Psychrobacillus sp. FSL H8-0510]|uniref:hypothetical protein n=1 Tax=Psychrobacillus sp. FSL H8-0510 TaxID=2921394 RepID=UPI0030F9BF86
MEKYGLSGYLAQDGVWYPCGYQEHCDKAVELVKIYQLNDHDYNNIAMSVEFIKFGTAPWADKEGSSICHVFIDCSRNPTEAQIEWLRKNIVRATDKQRREVELTFSAFYQLSL